MIDERFVVDSSQFIERLVEFSELLRANEFGVTPAETVDAARALMLIDVLNFAEFRSALKSALIKRSEDYEKFDQLFDGFWLTKFPNRRENPLGRVTVPSAPKIERTLGASDIKSNRIGRGRIIAGSMLTSEAPDTGEFEKKLRIYSPLETTSRKTFQDLGIARDRALLKRAMRSFARATATRRGRRFLSSTTGARVDFRSTIRKNLRTGGHAFQIQLREKKISKSRLVLLCDISGSMDSYSSRVLKLIYHLSNTVSGAKIFGFSTRVVSLDHYLKGETLKAASLKISEHVEVWSSGTRIGSALGDLLTKHSGVLRSTTVFVIISDGWELGDLAILRSRLADVRRRVRGIVWLNPQADSADFVPLAEGMKNSLPYIDIFAGLDIFTNRTKFKRAFNSNPLSN